MCKFFPVKGYAGINKAQKAVILGEHFARFLHWNPTDKDPAAAPAANQGGQKNQAALPADAEIDPMAVDLVAATIMGAYNKDELAQICEAYDIPQKAGTHRARQIAAYFLKKPQFQGTGGNCALFADH